ncbi:MAG: PilZ domain-containing protein [Gammaproteobacteria bacterium]|nr:PilZ domain-containing protein [Gammaproteobacteria bacterium]MDH5593462.1 PilZ domain-containing protein [Gammaproteobacteria bacterium]MDH5594317.1 PilZ domain-containing protein [Gammaproteobacteria bacterium]MDH5614476.1 PilZ domain-containing protein [Gammaproteobacteria bacterium]
MLVHGENRDYIRMTVDCQVSWRKIGTEEVHIGNTKNLSGKGILFLAEQEIPIGTVLEVNVSPENDVTPPLDATVEVVRIEIIEPGKYEIGCLIQELKS